MYWIRRVHLLFVVHTVEDDAHQTHVERLFHNPVVAVEVAPVGRKSRKQRHVRLRVALLQDGGLIGHGGHAKRQAFEIQRPVLHVHIGVVIL